MHGHVGANQIFGLKSIAQKFSVNRPVDVVGCKDTTLVCEEYERIKTLFLGLPEGVITGPFLEKDENLC